MQKQLKQPADALGLSGAAWCDLEASGRCGACNLRVETAGVPGTGRTMVRLADRRPSYRSYPGYSSCCCVMSTPGDPQGMLWGPPCSLNRLMDFPSSSHCDGQCSLSPRPLQRSHGVGCHTSSPLHTAASSLMPLLRKQNPAHSHQNTAHSA